MFDFVRRHTRAIQFVMLLLIFPAFIGGGVLMTYSSMRTSKDAVAEVGSQTITTVEWENAQRTQADAVRAEQPDVNPAAFETPRFKKQVLDALMRERVFAVAANELRFYIPDARLQRLFANDPALAAVRNPDGSLNKDLLTANGMSMGVFTERLRGEYASRQVIGGVLATSLAPQGVAMQALESVLQRREVQVATFAAKDYVAKAQPTEADLRKFYDDPTHAEQFVVPESLDIEYVVLDQNAVRAAVEVPEAQIRAFYDDPKNAGRFATAQERRASHILIKAEKGAADQRKAARAKAEALLAQVRKAPGTFAEVAKKNSEDLGSAANGGDLDWFGRGAMVGPFEDAVFAAKPGQISDLVETDFGFHIIMVTGERGGERQPFESVRAEIADELKADQVKRRYAQLAQRFSDLVYEKSDSLQPAAQELKLTVQKASGVTRKGSPALADLASSKFLQQLFDEKNRKLQRNTEAVDAGEGRMIAGRVVKYEPARKRPLAEVQAQIRDQWIVQTATRLAKEDAERQLAAWKSQPDGARLGAAALVSRNNPAGQPVAVVEAVLRAPYDKLPAWTLADLGGQGYAVVRINRVLPPEISAEERTVAVGQYGQMWSTAEGYAYYQALSKRFKARVTESASAVIEGRASAPAP